MNFNFQRGDSSIDNELRVRRWFSRLWSPLSMLNGRALAFLTLPAFRRRETFNSNKVSRMWLSETSHWLATRRLHLLCINLMQTRTCLPMFLFRRELWGDLCGPICSRWALLMFIIIADRDRIFEWKFPCRTKHFYVTLMSRLLVS